MESGLPHQVENFLTPPNMNIFMGFKCTATWAVLHKTINGDKKLTKY